MEELKTKTKTKDIMFSPLRRIKSWLKKHKVHIIYLLIIANLVVWAVAYQKTTSFYNEYVNLLVNKTQAQEIQVKQPVQEKSVKKKSLPGLR